MLKRTGDLQLIKELNKSIILDVIRKNGPISRAEIAKKVNLSPTTVTSAVSDLIRDSLVVEGGTGESSGGRKPILVQLNPDVCFLIGVAIDASKITIAELNLNAKVKRKEVHSLKENIDFDFCNVLIKMIDHFFKKCKNLNNCLGISITIQGIVDSEKGMVAYNPKLKIHNLPLKNAIEDAFNIPTYIDNDTNGSLLAEKGFGNYQQSKNLIYVTIGDGVGASMLVNDSIFRGFHGGAGEFGHTTIDYKGAPCNCGNVGCLENYVSWRAICSRIVSEIEAGNKSLLVEEVHEDLSKITPELFRKAIFAGDVLANTILDDMAFYLGTGLVNLIHLFNPERIILGGELAFENPLLIQKVNEHISRYALQTHSRQLEVFPSSFGNDSEVVGSASLLLHELFHFTLK
ncbi:ROK family transcriptional regulator [Lederbergia wuyishanensis]|uniref:ROK family transcriptional regulator n=1 Tax=Lederbergia wuyishanensis TaxID=1347903 RepID=UPI001FD0D3B9|nr:ROK family transcriptional regulator [Lederbergia wuyishanensis]MCJ8008261.1 ROK family transcriptional regulator [Lederbergia wuyishanensis]